MGFPFSQQDPEEQGTLQLQAGGTGKWHTALTLHERHLRAEDAGWYLCTLSYQTLLGDYSLVRPLLPQHIALLLDTESCLLALPFKHEDADSGDCPLSRAH